MWPGDFAAVYDYARLDFSQIIRCKQCAVRPLNVINMHYVYCLPKVSENPIAGLYTTARSNSLLIIPGTDSQGRG